jgi:hypothetical protein
MNVISENPRFSNPRHQLSSLDKIPEEELIFYIKQV